MGVGKAPEQVEELLFMRNAKAQGYTITFRCVNCGKNEVLAFYGSEEILSEDELRARIYQGCCNSCGWQGSVCGFSAALFATSGGLKEKATAQAN